MCILALIPCQAIAKAGATANMARIARTAEPLAATRIVGTPFILAIPAPAQMSGPLFPGYDNPVDQSLPPCTCKNLEELQDQLASAEFARKAFEEAATISQAGPGEQSQIQAELHDVGSSDTPAIRTSVTAASTDTSTGACSIDDSETRRTAPCEEIYQAFRAHEEHHREICLHYWKNRGRGPVNFQTGREYFLEEALAYQIAHIPTRTREDPREFPHRGRIHP